MSLHNFSQRVLAMGFWKYPGFRSAHSILSTRLSRSTYEHGMQASLAFFMCSSIVGVMALRRRSEIMSQRRKEDMIKSKMASDPKYANYLAAAQQGFSSRLAGGAAAAFPTKKK
mmetsp:Transcript_38892/g.62336  ORF Transcript_38892/g.62336 Transcript_38892/m.62336 type:complete len:114 (-) Transcript_38892:287-628(-)